MLDLLKSENYNCSNCICRLKGEGVAVLYDVQDYIIFLDEEVIPSADFLNFFRQCFEALTTDKTLSGISAWNPYGLFN